jgi:hypothetical protein
LEEHDDILESQLQEEAGKRRFIYSDLEVVIEFGYLEHHIRWRGVPISFRTLDQEKNSLLISRVGASKNQEWKLWFVAEHIHSIGFYVLEGRNSAWYVWDNWLKDLTSHELNMLLYVVMGLRKRVERCYKLVESFCYEPYSRALWRVKRSGGGHQHPIRQIWGSINLAEDSIEEDIKHWSHTRSVVGSMSSKWAKSLQQSEEKFIRKRKERSQRVIEETVNRVLFGDKKQEPRYIDIGGQKILVSSVESSRSVEDLEEEMMRTMRGEEDLHEMVVRRYKERAKSMMEEARVEREKAREEAQSMIGESGNRMVGYTEEQLRQMGVSGNRSTNVQVSETDQAFVDYINKPVKMGWIGISGTPEEAGKKDPGDIGSLQDRISGRRPTIK